MRSAGRLNPKPSKTGRRYDDHFTPGGLSRSDRSRPYHQL